MPVTVGKPCPAFKVEAAVSGRRVTPEDLAGRRAVLVLHGPRTAEAPKLVGKAVRAAFPSADDVMVANVVNLQSMAGLWKKVADAQIKATYEKMSTRITAGDPADYVLICPDYDNHVASTFGLDDTNQEASVVVLDDDGSVLGLAQGADLAEQTVELLTL